MFSPDVNVALNGLSVAILTALTFMVNRLTREIEYSPRASRGAGEVLYRGCLCEDALRTQIKGPERSETPQNEG